MTLRKLSPPRSASFPTSSVFHHLLKRFLMKWNRNCTFLRMNCMSGRSCHWRDNIRVYYQHIRVYCCYIRVNIHVNTLNAFLGIYSYIYAYAYALLYAYIYVLLYLYITLLLPKVSIIQIQSKLPLLLRSM